MDVILGPLAAGVLLGLSAGLAPGPLLALVISQTLRHGAGAGARVALAPLITDLPIVAICLWLVANVTGVASAGGGGAPAVLAAITILGGAFVAYLAWDTWRARPPSAPAPGDEPPAPRSWSRGALVNALSPHPWLTWIAIGAPTVIAAWRTGGPAAAASFVVGFYVCLIGAKLAVAALVGRARGRVAGRGYTLVMRGLAVLLAVFAAGLLREGVLLAVGAAG
jgi:threonine/homoserine/homoserine lactone efflux protein